MIVRRRLQQQKAERRMRGKNIATVPPRRRRRRRRRRTEVKFSGTNRHASHSSLSPFVYCTNAQSEKEREKKKKKRDNSSSSSFQTSGGARRQRSQVPPPLFLRKNGFISWRVPQKRASFLPQPARRGIRQEKSRRRILSFCRPKKKLVALFAPPLSSFFSQPEMTAGKHEKSSSPPSAPLSARRHREQQHQR